MAKVGWTVQSAFYDRNSHAVRESVPSLCREAAQSNQSAPANRRPAGQSDGSGNLAAIVAADRAFPAAVAELGR